MWISAVFLRACPIFAAGLLALGASGCPPPLFAAAPPPQPPAIEPSRASVPGLLKIQLITSRLWMDGEYVGRLERLDYTRLLARVRDRRAAGGGAGEAKTFELEVDAATDWQNAHHLLGLCDGFERIELVTPDGRFSLRVEVQGADATPESTHHDRTVVFVRGDSIAVWAGEQVPVAPPSAAEPTPERLIDVPRNGSYDEFEAGLRRVCSNGRRCSRVTLYFEEALHGRELLRVLRSIQRAPRGDATPPVISLALPLPPPVGEEARAFMQRDPDAGRLPLIVIRQVVRGWYGAIRDCLEGGLARHPKLAGLVTVRFVIERDGTVSNVAKGRTDLPDEEVAQCMIERFRGLRFPAPNGGIMTVEYPIRLRPRW